ncbi:RDD family protein [Candidatus Nucleicultrix amoebiphila]|uniref:RDD family protein n=1 Tax=Candidatus Nucleicultrix amoebiphila TaxID=1509244 RepID=UPI000A2682C9|nr:RDD family protein [Candidatus Nucleicultrix amoebiphila]
MVQKKTKAKKKTAKKAVKQTTKKVAKKAVKQTARQATTLMSRPINVAPKIGDKKMSVHYGGFWIRLVAFFIDRIVLGAIGFALGVVLMPIMMVGGGGTMTMTEGNQMMTAFAGSSALMGMGLGVQLIILIVDVLYFSLLQSSSWQATIGMKVCGIKVVGLDYQRISFLRALGRYAASILSGIILMIGYLMIAFTEKKQGLHDKLAETYVVWKS